MPATRWAPVRPDHRFADRALRVLIDYLGDKRLIREVLLAAKTPGAGRVKLPGFHLAERGAELSPWMWCVPRVSDDSHLINVYEEFVNRKLGFVNRPDIVARRLYRSSPPAAAYFGAPSNPGGWLVPGLKLVLAASHFDVPVERVRGGLRAQLGDYKLEVTNHGCWSNLRQARVPAFTHWGRADDAMTVRSAGLAHPIAHALVALKAPTDVLWAANSALRTRPELLKASAEDLLRERLPGGRAGRMRESVELAAREAVEIAQLAGVGIVPQLYEVLVPAVCASRRFRSVFGNPWKKDGAERHVSAETREAWVEHIQLLAKEACDAAA